MVLSDLIPTSSPSAFQCLGWNGINFCGITSRQTMGMGTRRRIGSFWQLTQFSWQRLPLRHTGNITEIRTIAADHLWMSPCDEQDCVTIHFTWKPDWPAVSKLLPVIERELAPFNARPHWGKLFTTSPAQLKSIYKRMPEFVELSRRYDPQGKFRNDYLNRNIFAA